MSNIPGLKERRLNAAIDAARRWAFRADKRQRLAENAAAGLPLDTAERIQRFAQREQERAGGGRGGGPRFIERIIGPTDELTSTPPDEQAWRAGRPVARIVSWFDERFEPDGFATGFMVSPRLLLTNHHVFPLGEDAGQCKAQFLYERVANGVSRGSFHTISTRMFHIADKDLDYALVGVEPNPAAPDSLESIGFIPLVASTGKVLVGHPMNIIQHPDGRPKQYATRENKLLDVLDDGYLHYTTDTLQGSSGAPVLNFAWEVVALHHSSVPLVVGGKVLTKASKPWDSSMSEDEIQWVANEGTRVSSIVKSVRDKGPCADAAQERLRQEFLAICDRAADARPSSPAAPATPHVDGTESLASETHSAQSNQSGRSTFMAEAPGNSGILIQINPTITINGTPRSGAGSGSTASSGGGGAGGVSSGVGAGTGGGSGGLSAVAALEKAIRFDRNYTRKKGYSPTFLKGFNIPLPTVAPARQGEMWMKQGDASPTVLNYHHYSLAMNQARQTCMWSAVNVDYSDTKRSKRSRKEFGTDKWIEDPRVPSDVQISDEEFYKPATKIDRGHIVRREDNCWGDTELEIEYANADTFHWTNCTVQHQAFNQEGKGGIWGRFESFITDEIDAVNNKASIFAGPVLAADDESHDYGFGPVQYPRKFWKVVATLSPKFPGKLFVTGFVFSQKDVLDEQGLERIDFTPWKKNRVTLKKITEMTGVVFPKVMMDADTL